MTEIIHIRWWGNKNIFLLGITASVLLVFAATATAQEGPQGPEMEPPLCQEPFCMLEITNVSGAMELGVCAGTTQTIRGFNFWYDGTGPLNLTNTPSNVTTAYYDNEAESPYNYSTGLNNETTPSDCVFFEFNQTFFPFTTNQIQFNMTVYNKTGYTAAAAEGNGSMLTLNYFAVKTVGTDGSPVPNAVFMPWDDATKSFLVGEPAIIDDTGYWGQHCKGIIDGNNACISFTGPDNQCTATEDGFLIDPENPGTCYPNSTVDVRAFDFISKNTSSATTMSPSTVTTVTLDSTATISFVIAFPFSENPFMMGGPMDSNVSSVNITEWGTSNAVATGNIQALATTGPEAELPPSFIEPNRLYNITVNATGAGGNYGSYHFPFMAPSPGVTGIDYQVVNGSVDTTVVKGTVLDEAETPVENAVVYAQQFRSGGSSFGISLMDAAVTTANGRFALEVPTTEFVQDPFCGSECGSFPHPAYQFYIVSNASMNGVNQYYPTIDNNDDRGYFAQGDTIVLAPLELKSGGRVDVNVTLNGASTIISELSKLVERGNGLSRSAATGSTHMLSLFEGFDLPAFIDVSLLSPVSAPGDIIYTLIGKEGTAGPEGSGGTIGICHNTAGTLAQAEVSATDCSLTVPGTVNLTVNQSGSLFAQQVMEEQRQTGSWNFWFDTELVIRNTTGHEVVVLGSDGTLLSNILGFGAQGQVISIPLANGTYTAELRPSQEFSEALRVHDRDTFDVFANQTTVLHMDRARAWEIRPMFSNSLTLSADNRMQVEVRDFALPDALNDSHISLTGKFLFLNNTAANNTQIPFQYHPDTLHSGGFNATVNPSNYITKAGKYWLFLNATNRTTQGGAPLIYGSSFKFPVNIFDFQADLDLGGHTFGTGQNVTATIYAFNRTSGQGLNAEVSGSDQSNITLTVFDQNGLNVKDSLIAANASDIANGDGHINFTMPRNTGFYQVVTKVISTDGSQGVSERWVRVSNLNLKVTKDRHAYRPEDRVELVVKLTDAANGDPIQNASIEAVVDGADTPILSDTGLTGVARLTLNPSVHSEGSSSTWAFGWHNIRIRISYEDETGSVNRLDTYNGFEVRGMEAFVEPTQPSYGVNDNVTIDVFFPPEVSVSRVEAVVDGNASESVLGQSQGGNGEYWQINLDPQSVGHHDVRVRVTDTQDNTQDFYTGFQVNSFIIDASTDRFNYKANQDIELDVRVSTVDGVPLDRNVTATLYRAQPPNDIVVTTNFSNATNGRTTLTLQAANSGFHYIEIDVEGQKQYVGIQVSSLNVDLVNATSQTVERFTGKPGGTATVYVNVSESNRPVTGADVRASIWAFGEQIELPSNTTAANGIGSVTFNIPQEAPERHYGLEVQVVAQSGKTGRTQGVLAVEGGNALRLEARPSRHVYSAGDTASFTALLQYPNGTGVGNKNITFEIGSEGGQPETIGAALTSSDDGIASVDHNVTVNDTDGRYFLHTYLTGNEDIRHFSGFLVSNIRVTVDTDKNVYHPGENVTFTVNVTNTNGQVTATRGAVSIFTPQGERRETIDPSIFAGPQPYVFNLTIPNNNDVLGTYPIAVSISNGSKKGSGDTLIDVVSNTGELNVTVPETVTAGEWFLVNLSSDVNGTADLFVFSPTAEQDAYTNESIPVNNVTVSQVNITINNPGLYIFDSFMDAVGGDTVVQNVGEGSGPAPAVWTGSDLTTNTTSFGAREQVYIITTVANATATVLRETGQETESFEIPLSRTTGSNYYGLLRGRRTNTAGTYFVRVDTDDATAVTSTIFTVQ